MENIGVLGTGIVGTTLANGFLQLGMRVMIGTRSAEKVLEWKANGGENALIGTPQEAAAFGEIVVLAVKGTAAEDVIIAAGVENLRGKTVIDTTNPIAPLPPTNGVLHYITSLEDSLMERLQRLAPEAHFVKAFSIVGSTKMVHPVFEDGVPTMFICGNNETAKYATTAILEQFGWETEDMGSVEAARAIEPLAMLWCIPGFMRNSWSHAFKLLKK